MAEKLGVYLATPQPPAAPKADVPSGVLPDTCAWIDYFRNPETPLGKLLERALREGPVFTCGQILSELLQGVKGESDRAVLLRALGTLEYVEMEPRLWLGAAEIAVGLRSRGNTIPHSDLLIAVVALQRGLAVLTADRHFEEIPGLSFFGRSPSA